MTTIKFAAAAVGVELLLNVISYIMFLLEKVFLYFFNSNIEWKFKLTCKKIFI